MTPRGAQIWWTSNGYAEVRLLLWNNKRFCSCQDVAGGMHSLTAETANRVLFTFQICDSGIVLGEGSWNCSCHEYGLARDDIFSRCLANG